MSVLRLLAFLFLVPGLAAAAPLDEFRVRVGGFLTQFDTTIRADAPGGELGTSVDFDRELGLEDRDLIEFVGFAWLPFEHHEIGVNYFHESLTGGRRLSRDIDFAGERFEIDTRVRSELVLESFEFHYTWWAFRETEWALGLRFGYLDYRMRASIAVAVEATGAEPMGLRVTTRSSFPAPSFGLDLRVEPATDWRINANIGWLEADLERVKPRVITARLGLEYLPWENVGLWADIGMNHLRATVYGSDLGGALVIEDGGLRLGVTYRL